MPNARCPEASRSIRYSPASSPNRRGSRLAAPMNSAIFVSPASRTPWNAASREVVRKKDWKGDSKRSASLTANRASAGLSCRAAHSEGWVARHFMVLPMASTVVSRPADSRARTSRVASSGVITPWSAYSQILAPRPSGVRFSRAQLLITHSTVPSPAAKYRA